MRPVLDAMEGAKKTVCDIYSDVLYGVIEAIDNDVICKSTEELIAAFENYNSSIENYGSNENPKRIIGSMDAKSLFTSLKAGRSSEIIKEEVLNSNVNKLSFAMISFGLSEDAGGS